RVSDLALRPARDTGDRVARVDEGKRVLIGLEPLAPADRVHGEEIHTLPCALAFAALDELVLARDGFGGEAHECESRPPVIAHETREDIRILHEFDGRRAAGGVLLADLAVGD